MEVKKHDKKSVYQTKLQMAWHILPVLAYIKMSVKSSNAI